MGKMTAVHAFKRRKLRKGRIFFLAGFTLAFLSSLARAETMPAAPEDPVTRIELMVTGKSEHMGGSPDRDPKADFDPDFERLRKAAADAFAKALKLSGDIVAQYPKCHFRITSLTAPESPSGQEAPPSNRITLRVTLLGDSGCLASGK